MTYIIFFTDDSKELFQDVQMFLLSVKDPNPYKIIKCLQKTSEESTTTYTLNDSSLPDDVKGDWNKIAAYLVA